MDEDLPEDLTQEKAEKLYLKAYPHKSAWLCFCFKKKGSPEGLPSLSLDKLSNFLLSRLVRELACHSLRECFLVHYDLVRASFLPFGKPENPYGKSFLCHFLVAILWKFLPRFSFCVKVFPRLVCISHFWPPFASKIDHSGLAELP